MVIQKQDLLLITVNCYTKCLILVFGKFVKLKLRFFNEEQKNIYYELLAKLIKHQLILTLAVIFYKDY